jgi:hypothetical protein
MSNSITSNTNGTSIGQNRHPQTVPSIQNYHGYDDYSNNYQIQQQQQQQQQQQIHQQQHQELPNDQQVAYSSTISASISQFLSPQHQHQQQQQQQQYNPPFNSQPNSPHIPQQNPNTNYFSISQHQQPQIFLQDLPTPLTHNNPQRVSSSVPGYRPEGRLQSLPNPPSTPTA